MDKEALAKIHPKFRNEQQCKNEKCGGYFLDKNQQEYCPACRRKGWGQKEVKNEGDLVYKEVNATELQAQVNELKKTVESLTQQLTKRKQLKPKKCSQCGKEFVPTSPNQKICQECRSKLTT